MRTLFEMLFILVASIGTFTALEVPVQAGNCRVEIRRALLRPSAFRGLETVFGAQDLGPQLQLPASSNTRDPSQIRDLVIGQYNVAMQLSGENAGAIAEVIRRADPDILVLEEIKNEAELRKFNDRLLFGRYRWGSIEGNDVVQIDGRIKERNIGFLIKKDIPLDVELQSYRNLSGSSRNHAAFTRDLPAAVFRLKGAPKSAPPLLVTLGAHYKSLAREVDTTGVDYAWRQEILATKRVIQNYQKQYGRDLPVMLAGDLNRDVRSEPGFDELHSGGYTDSFDLAPPGRSVPKDLRVTEIVHLSHGVPTRHQLDGILASDVFRREGIIKAAEIVPYLGPDGKPMLPHVDSPERRHNPSDHNMIRTILDFQKLLRLSR